MSVQLRVISLGAGVQSTTMALMAAHGEITPMPDCAIFADTQWEPKRVYDHLQWLMSPNVLPFPVHIISQGNLRDAYIGQHEGRRGASIPFHTVSGNKPRQCTAEYKVRPLIKELRRLVGLQGKRAPKHPVAEFWIGISVDEAFRMKPSREAWIAHRWPLIDQRMNRWDCKQWLLRHDYPIPGKSACLGCPYHNNEFWRELRDNSPQEWAETLTNDALIRTAAKSRGFREEAFMHRSLKPLDQVDLSTAEDRGQLNLFNNECEGMCGV